MVLKSGDVFVAPAETSFHMKATGWMELVPERLRFEATGIVNLSFYRLGTTVEDMTVVEAFLAGSLTGSIISMGYATDSKVSESLRIS